MKNTCVLLSFVLFVFSLSSHAAESMAHNARRDMGVEYSCDDSKCSAWFVSEGVRKPLVQSIKTQDIFVKWLSADLVDVYWSCGSPCQMHIYAGVHGISRLFDSTLAVDPQRECALHPTESGLGVSAIFSKSRKPFFEVKYNDHKYNFNTQSADVSSGIVATYLDNGTFRLKYDDSNDNAVTRSIRSRCSVK